MLPSYPSGRDDVVMAVDLAAAAAFMATYARVLDRRRFDVLFADGDAAALLAAADGYRNPDGGYGWGLEPDLRSGTSQPGGALHAFEAFGDAAPAATAHAEALCDWCDAASLPDGGLPFGLPVPDPAGSAPFWAQADSSRSSLLITSQVVREALRVPSVTGHPWVARASGYCRAAVHALSEQPHAIALAGAVRLFDALGDDEAMTTLARFIPADGLVHVAGGKEDEYMRPLDFAPRLFSAEVVEAELERLEAEQGEDGGWSVDFASYSPAASVEWRGYATVRALSVLRAHGRV
jgi:hypothetical protein